MTIRTGEEIRSELARLVALKPQPAIHTHTNVGAKRRDATGGTSA